MTAARAREVKQLKRAPLPHVLVDGKRVGAHQQNDGSIAFIAGPIRGRRFAIEADFSEHTKDQTEVQWTGALPLSTMKVRQ